MADQRLNKTVYLYSTISLTGFPDDIEYHYGEFNIKRYDMWIILTLAVIIISVLFGPEKFNLIKPETTLMQNCLWGGFFGGVSGGIMIMFIISWLLGFNKR